MNETKEWFRMCDRGDVVVTDGYFICRTQEQVDTLIRKLLMLRSMIPASKPEGAPVVPGGSDVSDALAA